MEKRRERQRVGSRGASEVSEQEERTEGVERGEGSVGGPGINGGIDIGLTRVGLAV